MPPPPEGNTVLACQVSDTGGIDDASFNASAWAGAQQAAAELEGVSVEFLESTDATDYRANIDAFIAKGCDVIITVGFLLADDTAAAAVDNPNQLFAIVDQSPGPFPPWADADGALLSDFANLRGLTFQTDEAAFLAGYMAAGASTTGVVGTFGGLPIPPVTIFMDGFVKGVAHYNSVKGTSVTALGYDSDSGEGLFTNNFDSLEDGRSFAETLVNNGADIVLPVAGPVGLGSAALCLDTGSCVIVGVDADWNNTAAEFSSVILTSILKNIDVSVYNTINNVLVLGSTGNLFNGTLANGGVGLAALQDNADRVSAELSGEVAALNDAIVAAGGLQAFLDSLVDAG
ncbi:MAG: BMP family ABC transporter substrate-binding protein [bacterium]|nr:BMP family ABC transporter substrate-binding protein [bacterium]